ncbi:hypothetical protein I4F81_004710 [Pyropia yezoensis]|uniref:Uncharacterized protein n=1 Tax=Pyropia yezoensis TaxID=2788 RepID=A0ACC3BWQ2_PYRYE|nr:hypothetical protein I4F81_004710 [Neopyropia yezoensis]
MARSWQPLRLRAAAPVVALVVLLVGWSAAEVAGDCVAVVNISSFYPRTTLLAGEEGNLEKYPLQNVNFSDSSTPITVSAGWHLNVRVRIDPACPSDNNSLASWTFWAAAISLSAPGTSRTLYTDTTWEVRSDDECCYSPPGLGPEQVDHEVPPDWAGTWLTHPPRSDTIRSTWSQFKYVFPRNVCDGLPSAAATAAADAAAAAAAATRALADERSRAGGRGDSPGGWTTTPIAVAGALGTLAAGAAAAAAALAATLASERRRGTVGGAVGGGQAGGDARATA